MSVFTTHTRPGAAPALVREGFSWLAAIFGWLWLLCAGAWIPAALVFAASVAVSVVTARWHNPALAVAQFLLLGCFGRDLLRWHLGLRGYRAGPAVVGGSHDAALTRFVTERPDLALP